MEVEQQQSSPKGTPQIRRGAAAAAAGGGADDVQMQQERKKCSLRQAMLAGAAVALSAAIALLVFLVVDLTLLSKQNNAQAIVVLVSIDSVRAEVISRPWVRVPNLKRLSANGVRAASLVPSFPSKTFPNHWTLATGLWCESHGIVGNRMFDPVWKEWFDMSTRASKWWQGEAVWETAARAGLKSGVCFWPGSEIEGRTPSFYVPYDQQLPYALRVKHILDWLALPEKDRPAFLALYLEGVDTMAHRFGPESSEADAALEEADVALGTLLEGIANLRDVENVTVIVVSDHGMAATPPSQTIFLEEDCGVVLTADEVIQSGAHLALNPSSPERVDELFDALSNCSFHLKVFRPEELPDRFHFRNNRRIAPIIGVPDIGWFVAENKDAAHSSLGEHGYDPAEEDMHGIFVARGPTLHNDGREVPAVLNVDLYEFICKMLGIDPAPNNGTGMLSLFAFDTS